MQKSEIVTYYKRKRGIIKKCIELSQICHQDVFLVIKDQHTGKLVEYNSSSDFNLEAVFKAKMDLNLESFSKFYNSDLELLGKNMTPMQFEQIQTTYKKDLKRQPPRDQSYDQELRKIGDIVKKLQRVEMPKIID